MLMERIADYVVAQRAAALPEEVAHHARRALLDWFAALLPGTVIAPATAMRAALAEEFGSGKALLYPDGARVPLRLAALVNGTASHTVEFDDIFKDAIYHPGCPTMAAAVAAAQTVGASGEALLRGIVAGYEVSTRIGATISPAHYRYWHTTGTVGCFGAAAAVAAILGLTRDQTMHALGTVGTFAAGLQQAFRSDSMSKPLHAGRAAEAGALAAMMAGKGVTGALDILDGPVGLGVAMSNGPDWGPKFADLGTSWNVARMTFKNHGCCGHCFAAIDGALALRAAHGIAADRVARVTVGTYRTALDVTGRETARTAFEGKFSLRYTVASALVHGSVRLDGFTPERLADPRVVDLMTRIDLVVDPELDAAFPQRRSARVTIETTDGRRFAHYQPHRKGDPDAPLSDAELTDKFLELAVPVIGDAGARRLRDAVWGVDRQGGEGVAGLVTTVPAAIGRAAAE
ncbi:MAG: MmgE/PrpD family protein [Alphaproteobacteria bacterium]|nr:MmgE/PrpD family protein [Alphaproteobacteria bacterium]